MIEFIEQNHLYLVDGILVKSVTQILQLIFPDKYKGINQNILNNKAKFGTTGHSIIEHLDINNKEEIEKTLNNIENKDLQICIKEYLRLAKLYNLNPLIHEQKVCYKHLFAGTLDMIAKVNNIESLIDIKFTSELDEEYLSWQLGMYSLALNKKFKKYYCLWLPKRNLGELREIKPKTKKEIIKKLEELNI